MTLVKDSLVNDCNLKEALKSTAKKETSLSYASTHGLQKYFFLRSKFWKKNENFSFVFQILKIHILRGQLE